MKKGLIIFGALILSLASKAQDSTNIPHKIVVVFDSYDVVYGLNSKPQPLSSNDSIIKVNNIEYIIYMIQKSWFYNALTADQKNQLNAIVQ